MAKKSSRYVDPQAPLDSNNLPLSSYGSVDPSSIPNLSKSYSETPRIADTGTADYVGNQYQPSDLDDKSVYESDIPNLEDERAQNQSTIGALGDATAKFLGKTFLSTVGNIAGTVYGVGDAIAQGDITKIWDNSFINAVDSGNKKLDDIFHVYKSADYKDDNILQKLFLHPTQFTDEATDTASFMAGAVLSEIATSGLGSETLVPRALKFMKYLSEGAEASEATAQLTSLATKGISLAGDLGTSIKHLAMGASYEGIVEARQATMELREKMIDDYQKQHPGEDMPQSVKDDIDDRLSKAGLFTYLGNLALVGGTNLLLFPKLFGLGHETSKIAEGAIVKDAESGLFKLANNGKHSILDNITTGLTKPFEESTKFGIQGTISNTAREFWDRKNDEEAKANTSDLLTTFAQKLAETYTTKEGWNNIGMGMIIGALGAPGRGILSPLGENNPLGKYGFKDVTDANGNVIGKEKLPLWTGGVKGSFDERAEEERKIGKVLNDLNQHTNYFKTAKANYDTLVENHSLQKDQDAALAAGDIFNFQNAKDDQIHSYVSSRIKNNLYQDLLDEVDHMKKLSPDEFYSSFKGDEAADKATDMEKIKFQLDTTNQFLARAENTKQAMKIADDVYRGDNDDLRDHLVHSIAAAKNLDVREKQMNEQLAQLSDGVITNLRYSSDIPSSQLGLEIDTLKKLIDHPDTTPAEKSQYQAELKNKSELKSPEQMAWENLQKVNPTAAVLNGDKIVQLLQDTQKLRQKRQDYLDVYNHLFTQEGQRQFEQAQQLIKDKQQAEVQDKLKDIKDKAEEDTKKKNIKETLTKAQNVQTDEPIGNGATKDWDDEEEIPSTPTKEASQSTNNTSVDTNTTQVEKSPVEATNESSTEVLTPEETAVVTIEKNKDLKANRDLITSPEHQLVKQVSLEHFNHIDSEVNIISLDTKRTIGNAMAYLAIDKVEIGNYDEDSNSITGKIYDTFDDKGNVEVNKFVDPKLFSANHYKVGDNVSIEVPTFAEMNERGTQEFGDNKYTNVINDVNEFPIAIKNEEGKIISYIPTQSNIKKRVADEFKEQALADNLTLRQFIFDNKDGKFKGSITSKSPGYLISDKFENQKSLFKALGDGTKLADRVKLGIVRVVNTDIAADAGDLYTDTSGNSFSDGEIINPDTLHNGFMYSIVPSSKEGSYIAYPMKVNKIGLSNAKTIVEAIKLFAKKDNLTDKEKQSINNISEFNFNNFKDVTDFINRIMYSSSKSDAQVNTVFKLFKDNLYLSSLDGDKYSLNDIINNQATRDELANKLAERYFSFGLKDLNSKDPYYSYSLDNDGVIQQKENPSYQHYLDEHSAVTTNLRRVHIDGNEYAFTAQPVIGISNSVEKETKQITSNNNEEVKEPNTEETKPTIEEEKPIEVEEKSKKKTKTVLPKLPIKDIPLDDLNPILNSDETNSLFKNLEEDIKKLGNKDAVAIYARQVLGLVNTIASDQFGEPFIRPYAEGEVKYLPSRNIKMDVFEHLAASEQFKDSPNWKGQQEILLNILKQLHPELSETEIKAAANIAWAYKEAEFNYNSDVHDELMSFAYAGKVLDKRFLFPTFQETNSNEDVAYNLKRAPFKNIDYNISNKLYDLTPINPNFSVMDKLFVNLDKFSDSQQRTVIKSIIWAIEEGKKEGYTTVDDLFDYARDVMDNSREFYSDPDINTNNQYDNLIQKFKDIDDNWDKFKEKTIESLKGIGVKVTKTFVVNNTPDIPSEDDKSDIQPIEDDEHPQDNFVGTEADYRRDYTLDVDQKSTKDTASAHLKLKLSLIPKVELVDGKLEPVANFLGTGEMMDLDKVWTSLQGVLTGLSADEIIPTITELAVNNPMYSTILQTIMNDPDTSIQNQFVVAFSQDQRSPVTVKIGYADKTARRTIRVFGTNRQGANNILMDSWYDKFKNSSVVTDDGHGNYVVDTKRGKEFNDSFNNFLKTFDSKNTDNAKRLKNGLDAIGINLSINTIDNLLKKGTKINGKKVSAENFLKDYVSLIFKRLSAGYTPTENLIGDVAEEEDSKLELNNPFISETRALTQLARLENITNPFLYESSYVGGDGKPRYSITNNTMVSKFFNRLKNEEKGLQFINNKLTTTYAANSIWGNKYVSDPAFRQNFVIHPLDSLGSNETNQPNKVFSKMNNKEKEFTRISNYQNEGRPNSMFLAPIYSDKPTPMVIEVPKIPVKLNEGSLVVKNDAAKRALYAPFIAEYNRIREVQSQQENPEFQDRLLQGYHFGMGEKFLVYDFLNKNKELFDEKGRLRTIDAQTLERIVTPEIQKFTEDLIRKQVKYWKQLGLLEKDTPFYDKSFDKKFGDFTDDKHKLAAFAAEYAINQFISHFNYTQLISGDPALHGKSNIDKTWINYNKRLAKDVAPGLDGLFDKPQYTTVFLKDLKYTSKLFDKYQEVIKERAEAYKNMNPADAQEYTTLAEHLAVMKAYGKLTPELEAAGKRLIDGGSNESDIDLILQPMKPVYAGTMVDKSMGIDRMYYIKTSSFPLIPALTKGLEIDKLRVAMETAKVDRAVYESGVKLGLPISNIVQTESSQGVIRDDLDLSKNAITLDRDGFRIQQEVPYHSPESHSTVNEGTQGRKLILLDVDDDHTLHLFDSPVSGKDAKQIYENLHIEKMNRALKGLLKDIGAETDGSSVKIKDLSKLQKILIEEASSRNYNVNDVYGLQIETVDGVQRFKIPLGFNNSSSRLESILNSLFTNRVIKSELPGFSKIQGSSAGFSRLRTLDQLNAQAKDSIVWVNPNDTTLNYIRKSEDGTVLLQAEILVPSWFTGKDGKLIDMTKFLKEDGTLDTDRLPENLLTTIGIRIPTQGYNSMMSFKVKGFLPKTVGDLAIVPAEIVAQMGSDFDVDKLFMYRYHYKFDGNKFSKIEGNFKSGTSVDENGDLKGNLVDTDISKFSDEQIDNSIIQYYEDRYKDVDLLPKILEPNGYGDLPKLADEIKYIQNLDSDNHFFSTIKQNEFHKNNNDGIAGRGIFSLFSTFIRAAQDAKLALPTDKSIDFKIDNKIVRGNKLYGKGFIENKSPSTVVQYLQSASVDNAKEQLLGYLNINPLTMDVAGTILLAGFDENHIGYFLSQPILRDYVNELSNANDITNPVFKSNAQRQLEVLQKLKIEKYPTTNKEDESLHGYISGGVDNSSKYIFSIDELKEELKNPTNENQIAILDQFLKIKDMAKSIRMLQNAINVDTNGLGTRFVDLQVKANNIDIVKYTSDIINAENLFQNNTISKATDVLYKALGIGSNILPYETGDYISNVQSVLQEMGKADRSEINAKDLKSMYDSFKSYIYSHSNLLGIEDVNVERNRLLFGSQALGNRWEAYTQTPAGKKNMLSERLLVRRGKGTSDPIRLEALNTPAANTSDTSEAMLSYYRMYHKGTEEEKQLAKDLVNYFVLTGAKQGPSSIAKFIPYDILEEHGFSDKLHEIDKNLRDPQVNVLANAIEQFFQHNPSKASAFDPKSKDIHDYKRLEGFTMDGRSSYLVPDGYGNLTYPTYMSVYDREAKDFMLYKISKSTPLGSSYSRIDLLGADGIDEYNASAKEGQYSIFKNNQANLPIPGEITNRIEEDKSQDDNLTKSDKAVQIVDKNFLTKHFNLDNNNPESTLTTIANGPNKEFANIANDLKRVLVNFPNLKIDTNLSREGVAGSYVNNTISINIDNALNRSTDPINSISKTILHEMIHAITAYKINNYDKLSPEDKKSVDKIKILFNQYNRIADQEGLQKFKDITEKLRNGQQVSDEDKMWFMDNKSEFYPLTNIHEFVAGLTDMNFVAKLKDNNFWDKLWKAVANLLGLNESYKNDYDALYNTTLDLGGREKSVEETKEETPNTPQVKTYEGQITKLEPNQVFVFGSNTQGRHGMGAALFASRFAGAKYGQAEGPQGQSYAIVTKDLTKDKHPSVSRERIVSQIQKLYEYANQHPDKDFLVAYNGAGKNLNGYGNPEMAKMFSEFPIPSNMVFEEGFSELLTNPDSLNDLAPKDAKTEFLNKYHLYDGKPLTAPHFDRIKSAMEKNSKYNNIKIDLAWENGKRVLRVFTKGGTPLYDIDPKPVMPKSKEERIIEKSLKRLYDIRNKFQSNPNYAKNPGLQAKVEDINNQIKQIKAENTVSIITAQAKDKLASIETIMNRPGRMSAYDIDETKRYLSWYANIRNYITYNEAFAEENKNLDDIVRKSIDLNNELDKKKLETLSYYFGTDINPNVDLGKVFNQPNKDVGNMESTFESAMYSSSPKLQAMQTVIRKAELKTNDDFSKYQDKIVPVFKEFQKKYKNYNAVLQLDKDGNPTGRLLNKYKHEFWTKKKYDRTDWDVKITEEDKERYNADVEQLKSELPDWNKEGTHDYAKFKQWTASHNPDQYIAKVKKGSYISKEERNKYKDYVTSTPNSKWIDPRYTALKAFGEDSVEMKVYNELDSQFRSMAKLYGNESNYIPEVKKDYMDRMLEGDFKGAFKAIQQLATDSVTTKLESTVNTNSLDINGLPNESIPVYMMSNVMNPADKSYDLGRVLLAAKLQEFMLNHKNEIEPYLQMMKELTQKQPAYKVNTSDQIVTDDDGTPILDESPGRAPNITSQSNYMLESFLYDRGVEHTGANPDATIKRTTLNAKGEPVTETRALTGSKVVDTVSAYTRLKALGLNPVSSIGRVIWGVLSNTIYAGDRKAYGERENIKSFGYMLEASLPWTEAHSKVKALAEYFDMRQQLGEIKFGKFKLPSINNPLAEATPYVLVNKTEDFIQHQTGISVLMKEKVTDLSGVEHDLFDAFDGKGEWKTDQFGPNPYDDDRKRLEMSSHIQSVVTAVHGDYGDATMASQKYILRNLLTMRKWLPRSISVRFGKEYQTLSGDIQKGRYLSYKLSHLAVIPLIKDMYKAFTTDENADSIDNRNLRMNAYELAFIPVLWGAALAMKAMLHGLYHDDDKEKAALTFLLNSTTRVSGDLTFFYNPYSFQAVIREPIPAFKTLMDFADLGQAVAQTIEGKGTYKTGIHKGHSKIAVKLAKALPIVNIPEKVYSATKQAIDNK